jgi:hypothetical protein
MWHSALINQTLSFLEKEDMQISEKYLRGKIGRASYTTFLTILGMSDGQ